MREGEREVVNPTGKGISVISHYKGNFVISELVDILVIPRIEDWV